MKTNKYKPAYIDIFIVCMHCGTELYSGVYRKGCIRPIREKIKKEGWVHHPTEGTLCPECLKMIDTKENPP